MANDVSSLIQTELFVYALPFLLTFAVVYAFSGNIFKADKKSRTIISVVAAALTLPFAPKLSGFLSTLTSSFLIVVGGLLILVVLFEVLGVKHKKLLGVNEKTGKQEFEEKSIFEHYAKPFAVVIIGIALLVFVQSGGLELLGIRTGGVNTGFLSFINAPLVFFIAVIAIMVWWVSAKSPK